MTQRDVPDAFFNETRKTNQRKKERSTKMATSNIESTPSDYRQAFDQVKSEEVRAAVQYIRHHEGDADSIIPSLFAGRGGRKKATDDTNDKPQTPVPVPPITSQPNNPGTNPTPAAKVDVSELGPFMH
jgi:hypothetical protein